MNDNVNMDIFDNVDDQAGRAEKSRRKRLLHMIVAVVIAFVAIAFGIVYLVRPAMLQRKYDRALELLENEEYEEAYVEFKELGNFKDSKDYFRRFRIYYDKELLKVHDGGEWSTECILNEKGQLLSKTEKDAKSGKVKSLYEYTYDEEGNLLSEHSVTLYGEADRSREYEYDKNGNLISTRVYTDGKLYDKIFYEYDKNGNCIKLISDIVIEYKYDEKGNMTEETRYDEAGKVTSVRRYSYDRKGNNTRLELFEANGDLRLQTTNTYNSSGKLLTTKETYPDGDLKVLIKYKYDKMNNVLTETSETPEKITLREYEYNRNGKMLFYRISALDTSVFADENEEYVVYGEKKCTYDKNGNLLTEYCMNYDENFGKSESTNRYTYDEEGNEIRAEYSSGWNETSYFGERHVTYQEKHSHYKMY